MKKLFLLLIVLIVGNSCQSKTIVTEKDSTILTNLLTKFADKKDNSTSELVVEIGKTFLGTPYVASTLENGKEENLVVNLRELDCTTYAENCLAIALTVKSEQATVDQFTKELEQIRYRQGKRDGYLSRLHYFSDWIFDNHQKGLVSEPASAFGSPLDINVNFMSTHPDSYPVLKTNPELVPTIAMQEKEVSSRNYSYLKKEDVATNEINLHEGDIVGITTTIKGMEIAHVGILIKVDGRIHLMHASSALEKVVISDEPLADFLMKKKSYTGIMIARPE